MDKNNLKNKISDAVEVLNTAGKKLLAFEGFNPNRYLIKDKGAKGIEVEVEAARFDELKTVQSRLVLTSEEEGLVTWFFATAERQVNLYEIILHELEKANQEEGLYVAGDTHQQ